MGQPATARLRVILFFISELFLVYYYTDIQIRFRIHDRFSFHHEIRNVGNLLAKAAGLGTGFGDVVIE